MEEEKSIVDMYLAAALLAYGSDIVRVDRADKKRQRFVFREKEVQKILVNDGSGYSEVNSPTIGEIEMYFLSRKLAYPPSYPDAIRSIKSVIHSV